MKPSLQPRAPSLGGKPPSLPLPPPLSGWHPSTIAPFLNCDFSCDFGSQEVNGLVRFGGLWSSIVLATHS